MRGFLAACLVLVLFVPSSSAWLLAPVPAPSMGAQWTTGFSPRGDTGASAALDAAGLASASLSCALGDVNADGTADLLVREAADATHPDRLVARAGPDFQTVLWQLQGSADRLLQCAPDVDLDGAADPIITTLGAAGSAVPGATGAIDSSQQAVRQVVSGADGAVQVARQATQETTGALGATASSATALVPAAAGAAGYLTTQVKGVVTTLPMVIGPLSSLTTAAAASATLQLLSATGAVIGTIQIDQPGLNPLAIVPIPTSGIPQIAVLATRAVSPVTEVAAQIPVVQIFNPDGSLAWESVLDTTTGIPMMVPGIGDLNADGIADVAIETVSSQVDTTASSGFEVLSGVDGTVLASSGDAVSGLAAVVPLGPAGEAAQTAVLSVEQAEGATTTTLSAVTGEGSPLWTVDVPAAAEPVNVAVDAFTGEAVGFTDLTGDAVSDVALKVTDTSGTTLEVIDGATGTVVAQAPLGAVDEVVAYAPMAAEAASEAGAALPSAAGATTDLVALAEDGVGLERIDGVTGEVVWSIGANASLPDVATEVAAAGDVNGDGVGDLLLTVTQPGAASQAGPSMPGATAWSMMGSGAGGASYTAASTSSGSSYVVSGADGSVLYATQTDGSSPMSLSGGGPAPAPASAGTEHDSPGISATLALGAIAMLAVLVRRRNA